MVLKSKITITSKFLQEEIDIPLFFHEKIKDNADLDIFLVLDGSNLLDNKVEQWTVVPKKNTLFVGLDAKNESWRFNYWTFNARNNITCMEQYLYTSDNNIGGGGKKYYQFLKTELIPILKDQFKNYFIKWNVIGCSLGAYYALELTCEKLIFFSNMILLSPAIWFNKKIIQDISSSQNFNDNLFVNIIIWSGLKEPKYFKKTIPTNYNIDAQLLTDILWIKPNVKTELIFDAEGCHGWKWWINFLNNNFNKI